MPRISIQDALAEKEDDDGILCKTCKAPAEEGSPYCWMCASYWEDCDNGLWQDDWPEAKASALDGFQHHAGRSTMPA